MRTQIFKRTAIALVIAGGGVAASLPAFADDTTTSQPTSTELNTKITELNGKYLTLAMDTGTRIGELKQQIKDVYGKDVTINDDGTFSLNEEPSKKLDLGTLVRGFNAVKSDFESKKQDLNIATTLGEQAQARLDVVDKKFTDINGKLTKTRKAVSDLAEGIRDNVVPAIEANRTDIDANRTDIDKNTDKLSKVALDVSRLKNGIEVIDPMVVAHDKSIKMNAAAIREKASTRYVDGKLADKADKTALSAVEDKLDDKADVSLVEDHVNAVLKRMDSKAEQSDLASLRHGMELLDKESAEHTHLIKENEGKIKTKASKDYVDDKLADKADKATLSAVENKLKGKADVSLVEDHVNAVMKRMDSKAEQSDLDATNTRLSLLRSGMETLDKATVENTNSIKMHEAKIKATKDYVDGKLDEKVSKEELTNALKDNAKISDVLAYHNATLDTLKDTNDRVSRAEEQLEAINDRHAKVDENKRKLAEHEKNISENEQHISDNANKIEEQYEVLGAIADNVDEQITTLVDYSLSNFQALDNRLNVLSSEFDQRLNNLDKKMKRGLAAQAALSGLFQPYTVGKFNATAAVGGYKSATAVAVGAGYRFNEHVAAKAGVSFAGHGDVSYHAGMNFEW